MRPFPSLQANFEHSFSYWRLKGSLYIYPTSEDKRKPYSFISKLHSFISKLHSFIRQWAFILRLVYIASIIPNLFTSLKRYCKWHLSQNLPIWGRREDKRIIYDKPERGVAITTGVDLLKSHHKFENCNKINSHTHNCSSQDKSAHVHVL